MTYTGRKFSGDKNKNDNNKDTFNGIWQEVILKIGKLGISILLSM